MEQIIFSILFWALLSIPLIIGYIFTLLPILMVAAAIVYFIFSWLFGYAKLATDYKFHHLTQPLRRYFEPEAIYFEGKEEDMLARSA